jgi:hypothetical protein
MRAAQGASSVFLSFLALTFSIAHSEAADRYTVCRGEFDRNCPVKHDVMINCGSNIEDSAKSICDVHDAGDQHTTPYRIVTQGSTYGGSCGYEWYLVTCLDAK